MSDATFIEKVDDLDEFLANEGFVQTDSNEQAYGVIRALDGWNPRVSIVTEEYFPDAIAILAYIGDRAALVGQCPPELTPNAMETMAFDASAWTNKLDAYTSWETAWWREVIQNASDARGPEKPEGATRVELECRPESYTDAEGVTTEAMRVSATDNGVGMNEDVLRNAFLAWSGSHKPEGSTGGFGDAKELIIIPWLGYEIHTRDRIARGRHNQFEIFDADYFDGTRVTTWMPLSKSTTPAYAVAFLDRSFLPTLRISVNGKRKKADLTSDRLVHGFPQDVTKTWHSCPHHPDVEVKSKYDWSQDDSLARCPRCGHAPLELQVRSVGSVSVYHNPRTRRRGVLVRSNGIYMFSERLDPSKYKGVVLVELSGVPRDLFNQKRDGFSKLTDVEEIVEQFVARLTVDVRTALKKARADKGKDRLLHGGSGAFEIRKGMAAKVAAKMAMDTPVNQQKQYKDGSVAFDKEAIEKIAEKVAEESDREIEQREMEEVAPTLTEDEKKVALEQLLRRLRNSAAVTKTVLAETRFASPEHAADALKLFAWQPMFLIVNEVDFFTIPGDLTPEKMKPTYRKIGELWMELCRFVLMRLGWSKPFGVGWIFSWDKESSSTAIAAYTQEPDKDGDVYDFLLLNPVKLTEDKTRYDKDGDVLNITYKKTAMWKITDDAVLKRMCAIAVHEATHMVNGISEHNEAFTSAMTENMGALMDMLPVAKKIRKALASRAHQQRLAAGPTREAILKQAKKMSLHWDGRYGFVRGVTEGEIVPESSTLRERFEFYKETYGDGYTLYDQEQGSAEFKTQNDAKFEAAKRVVEETGGMPVKGKAAKRPGDWEQTGETSWTMEQDGNILGEIQGLEDGTFFAWAEGRMLKPRYKSVADAKRAIARKRMSAGEGAEASAAVVPRDVGDPMFARLWILFLYAWARHPENVKESTYEGTAYARSLVSEVAGRQQGAGVVVPTVMQQMIEDPESYALESTSFPVKLTAKNTRDLEMDGREAWNVFSFSSKGSDPMAWDDFELKRLAQAVGAIYDLKALAKLRSAA